jgi:hypothetical protein
MVSHMGTTNRGCKTANYTVLVNTNMAAILCEVAFIDNAGDGAKLGSASYRQEAARAYLHGTQTSYGISPHDPVTTINPPYLFGSDAQGWTAGNSASGIAHTGSSWGGSIYFDQTGNDCWIYSPSTSFTGSSSPQVINVNFYPQSGTTAAHDMQLFWKTDASNAFTADKSSPIVNYNAQNAWATTNLSVSGSAWSGQTVNQLRLDFDNTNHSTRFIINHVVLQDALWWPFDSSVMSWSAGHSLSTPWQSSDGWPGVLVTDQTGDDAYLLSPSISGSGWPYNYIGGVNDWITVRVYPQSGNSAVHDMTVYWTTDSDGTWNDAKSTRATYTGQNQWVDVNLPVGLNSAWPEKHITQLRLDFDQANHGNRWLVDSIASKYYGADTTAPSTPTDLTATLASGNTVNLAWTASSDTRGVNGYKIYRDGTQIATSVAASYADASCSAGVTYAYQVAAYDASGNVSGMSTSASITIPVDDTEPPTTPTNLTATATGATTVALTWTASTDNVGIMAYEVQRDGSVIGQATGTSYTDNSVSMLTTYVYAVRARDMGANYSSWSESANVTTQEAPPTTTTVFADGFDGNLNNWSQQTAGFAYSTTVSHGALTGGGAAYCGAGEADQMFHQFDRPFAQGTVSGWFYDAKGGWKAESCGYTYRQALSLRNLEGTAGMFIDNELYSAGDNTKYFYRTVGTGGVAHTAYATRNPNTSCDAAWIYFETTVNAGDPGGLGTIQVLVTDGAGTTTAAPAMTSDFYDYGIGRVTLGLGVSSANDCYWDDVVFQAVPPGVPTMGTAESQSDTSIRWNFARVDNNVFGFDVADGAGTIVAPQYPTAGWLNRAATSWTESSLTPNTQYSRKVRAWNGTLSSAVFSKTVSAYTLAPAPNADSLTANRSSACPGNEVTWTAVAGFGAGQAQYYRYAWNTNPTYTFTGSEPSWSSGTLTVSMASGGSWYLHVQAYNAADVASGTYDYAIAAASTVPSDFDTDCDVDGTDVDHMAACMTGSDQGPPSAACANADLDDDNDVDQSDFALLQKCLSGDGVPAESNCGN